MAPKKRAKHAKVQPVEDDSIDDGSAADAFSDSLLEEDREEEEEGEASEESEEQASVHGSNDGGDGGAFADLEGGLSELIDSTAIVPMARGRGRGKGASRSSAQVVLSQVCDSCGAKHSVGAV